jgi:methanogenic corrinoid protein MtbC1
VIIAGDTDTSFELTQAALEAEIPAAKILRQVQQVGNRLENVMIFV